MLIFYYPFIAIMVKIFYRLATINFFIKTKKSLDIQIHICVTMVITIQNVTCHNSHYELHSLILFYNHVLLVLNF